MTTGTSQRKDLRTCYMHGPRNSYSNPLEREAKGAASIKSATRALRNPRQRRCVLRSSKKGKIVSPVMLWGREMAKKKMRTGGQLLWNPTTGGATTTTPSATPKVGPIQTTHTRAQMAVCASPWRISPSRSSRSNSRAQAS
jgi:hypothetical protein